MARRKRTLETVQIQKTMNEAGVFGAKLIRDCLRGKDATGHKLSKPISMTRIRAAIEAVNHSIGYPKQKIDIKTGALTMQEIAELATSFDKEPTIELLPKEVKSGQN